MSIVHATPRFADQSASKAFYRLLRESNVDATSVAAWKAAHAARTYNIKANTAAKTWATIIEKEAVTFAALTALLNDAGDAAVRLISVQAAGQDTNTRVKQIQDQGERVEKQLADQAAVLKALKSSQDEQRAVTVDCRMPPLRDGQSSSERKLQLQANVRNGHTMIKQIDIFNKGIVDANLYEYTIAKGGATTTVTGLPDGSTVQHLKQAIQLQAPEFFNDDVECLRFRHKILEPGVTLSAAGLGHQAKVTIAKMSKKAATARAKVKAAAAGGETAEKDAAETDAAEKDAAGGEEATGGEAAGSEEAWGHQL